MFNWFISLTNTAGFTSWAVCCIAFIRFRKGCLTQGVTVPYRSRFQPYAAYICLPIFIFLLLCNGFTVFYPGQFTVSGFLTTYLGIPIFLILWIGHKLIAARSEPWMYKADSVDLSSGLAEVEADSAEWTRMEEMKQSAEGMTAGKKLFKKVSVIWG